MDNNESESKLSSKAAKPCHETGKAQPKRQYCNGYGI